nr:hypothetical protein [Tanacetum cinerariifolium]
LSRFSTEAEYRCVANVVAKTCWLRNLLRSRASCTFSLSVCGYFHKRVTSALFEEFRSSLRVRDLSPPTTWRTQSRDFWDGGTVMSVDYGPLGGAPSDFKTLRAYTPTP